MKFFATILVLGAVGVLATRDTTYPACDNTDGTLSPKVRTTSFPVKYIPANPNPSAGACGQYTDAPGVCVKPGYVHSGYANHCGAGVELSRNGVTIKAKVVDVCGADAGSTMGCDDLFLTKDAFVKLGGNTTSNELVGKAPVTWHFTTKK